MKIFTLFHFIVYQLSGQKSIIDEDMSKWKKEYLLDDKCSLSDLLVKYNAFRSVFSYRIRKEKNILFKILIRIADLLLAKQKLLFITTSKIAGGLFFLHGFSTIVSAKSIGKNCWINQQVTIGYTTPDGAPTIGDNVRIYAGAKVLGDIHIGNNVIVGANAVVVKNVPDNCTVAGVPAKIIRKDGIRMHLKSE
jgi:serine O-acetyltransferase